MALSMQSRSAGIARGQGPSIVWSRSLHFSRLSWVRETGIHIVWICFTRWKEPAMTIPTKVVAGTLALSLLVLLAAYLLGGFAGLTANGAGALIFGVIASFGLGLGLMVA